MYPESPGRKVTFDESPEINPDRTDKDGQQAGGAYCQQADHDQSNGAEEDTPWSYWMEAYGVKARD